MRSHRVEQIGNYLSPASAYWSRVPAVQVAMMPTPLAMQPTAYVRNSWKDRTYGQTPSLEAASVHDGENWALRASWRGSGPGPADFPDAIAVALPVRNNPVLALMGGENAPIHYLRWSAGKKGLLSILATGIGLSVPGPDVSQEAHAVAEGSIWHVVMARTLRSGPDVAPLVPGKRTGIGFALWQGANDERAGIKAFSVDWAELLLDA